jgi:hypothetical protein
MASRYSPPHAGGDYLWQAYASAALEGQLPRSQATAIEEAVLRHVDREGEWR